MKTFQEFNNTKHFPNLDLFRALSIILVMLHHSFIPNKMLETLMHNGNHGVSLFFLISGFLITTLLIREKNKGSINIKKFLIRRGLRIYPLYYTVLAIYFVAINVFGFYSPDNRLAFNEFLYAHLFYLSNLMPIYGPFFFSWSLATEEQFYLIFSILIKKFKQMNLIRYLLGIIIIKVSFYYLIYAKNSQDPYVNFIHYFLRIFQESIILGVVLALLMAKESSYKFLRNLTSKLIIPATIIIITLLLFFTIGRHSTINSQLYNLCFVLIVFYSVTSKSFSRYIGKTLYEVFSYIGLISYGIYLFHMPIGNALNNLKFTESFMIFFTSWVLLVVVIASLSYELFEKRFIKLKKRFY